MSQIICSKVVSSGKNKLRNNPNIFKVVSSEILDENKQAFIKAVEQCFPEAIHVTVYPDPFSALEFQLVKDEINDQEIFSEEQFILLLKDIEKYSTFDSKTGRLKHSMVNKFVKNIITMYKSDPRFFETLFDNLDKYGFCYRFTSDNVNPNTDELYSLYEIYTRRGIVAIEIVTSK